MTKDQEIITVARQNVQKQVEKIRVEYQKHMEKDIENFKKQLLKQNEMMFGTLSFQTISEWTGKTKQVGGHDFKWPDYVAGDLSKSKKLRFSLKGSNDSYLALAEEKEQNSKKITYVLGGWGNKHSTVAWP